MKKSHERFEINPQQMLRDSPILLDLYHQAVSKMGIALTDVAQLTQNPMEEAALASCVSYFFFKIAMGASWLNPVDDGSRTRVSELVQMNTRMLYETFMTEYDSNPILRKQFGARE